MLRLKANKTSLYKLVSDYKKLPPMRRVTFTKAPRQPDYWLERTDADGLRCKAYLAGGAGRSLLAITRKEVGGPEVSRVVYSLELEGLRERGMVEEFTTAAERRRAKGGGPASLYPQGYDGPGTLDKHYGGLTYALLSNLPLLWGEP